MVFFSSHWSSLSSWSSLVFIGPYSPHGLHVFSLTSDIDVPPLLHPPPLLACFTLFCQMFFDGPKTDAAFEIYINSVP